MMHTPIGTIPRFEIGRASDMRLRSEGDIEVTNVAVRTDDRATFHGVIRTRESLVLAAAKISDSACAMEVVHHAQAAQEAIASGCPPELVIANLEACAAFAIGLLTDLKGNG